MLLGHLAVALAAKPAAPRVSLGTLAAAALLSDVCGFVFLAAGLEHFRIQPGITAVNPLDLYDFAWSHSLLTTAVWGALLAGGWYWVRRSSRGAWVIFGAALSHWLLDFASHRPDMALAPGVHRYFGLGLWYSIPATFAVEGLLWLVAIVIYVRATRPRGRAGSYLFWIPIALLTLLWIAAPFSQPPPNTTAVLVANLVLLALELGWSYGIDRFRPVQPAGLSASAAAWQ